MADKKQDQTREIPADKLPADRTGIEKGRGPDGPVYTDTDPSS